VSTGTAQLFTQELELFFISRANKHLQKGRRYFSASSRRSGSGAAPCRGANAVGGGLLELTLLRHTGSHDRCDCGFLAETSRNRPSFRPKMRISLCGYSAQAAR
jgi:hypothetical protein